MNTILIAPPRNRQNAITILRRRLAVAGFALACWWATRLGGSDTARRRCGRALRDARSRLFRAEGLL
jgi:hypothetical protein